MRKLGKRTPASLETGVSLRYRVKFIPLVVAPQQSYYPLFLTVQIYEL